LTGSRESEKGKEKKEVPPAVSQEEIALLEGVHLYQPEVGEFSSSPRVFGKS